ncbi:hypothetical protein [Kitasatospora purpeofusca]
MAETNGIPESPDLAIRVLNPEGSKGNGQFGWHFWRDPADTNDTAEDCE